mgnify:CR=1 FL=1
MCLIDITSIQMQLIRIPAVFDLILTVITGMFPSYVHAVMLFLSLLPVLITLMVNLVATMILHVILIPGITRLPGTVTARLMDRLPFFVRPVVLYLQQTSAIAGHRAKMTTRRLKIQGRRRACYTYSPQMYSA